MTKNFSGYEHADTMEDESRWPELIRLGDETVFEKMFVRYAAILVSYADSYVDSREIAEEVVQDVFLWVWDNRDVWSPRMAVRAYLYGAVRNAALGVLRQNKLRDKLSIKEKIDPTLGTLNQKSAEDVILDNELMNQLTDAIDGLAEKRREVVYLRWMHKLSYSEIAAVVESSPKAVEIQLYRAMQDLKKKLGNFGN